MFTNGILGVQNKANFCFISNIMLWEKRRVSSPWGRTVLDYWIKSPYRRGPIRSTRYKMERPRWGCVNLPYLAGTKKRPVKKGPYKLISPSKYKHSWMQMQSDAKDKTTKDATDKSILGQKARMGDVIRSIRFHSWTCRKAIVKVWILNLVSVLRIHWKCHRESVG